MGRSERARRHSLPCAQSRAPTSSAPHSRLMVPRPPPALPAGRGSRRLPRDGAAEGVSGGSREGSVPGPPRSARPASGPPAAAASSAARAEAAPPGDREGVSRALPPRPPRRSPRHRHRAWSRLQRWPGPFQPSAPAPQSSDPTRGHLWLGPLSSSSHPHIPSHRKTLFLCPHYYCSNVPNLKKIIIIILDTTLRLRSP